MSAILHAALIAVLALLAGAAFGLGQVVLGAGLVVAAATRPSIHRPHRRVDSNLKRCTVTATPAIRWWPKETQP